MDKEMIKEDILKSYNFRHACKLFDENRKISDEDFEFLLEIARLSPSSFGMQGWKFYVVESKDLREKLKPVCWGQEQITTASHLIVFSAKTEDLKAGSDYVKERFLERGLEEEATKAYIKKYGEYLSNLKSPDIYQWSGRQLYIVLGNMMSAAAQIGIDSCAIEGFEKEKVEEVLGIDTEQEEVALLCAFGFRINEPKEKIRLSKEKIVVYK